VTGGFVRAARASDAPELARVQVASWQGSLAGLVPETVIAELSSEQAVGQFTERWEQAITAPPTSKHRIHVAVEKPGEPGILGPPTRTCGRGPTASFTNCTWRRPPRTRDTAGGC
jgi:hypothetical protein